ncbi:MAG: LLM class F420-dependent oxidoreductase [Pseudomonadota bacterium]
MADFGVLIFPTAYAMPIDKLARELEARGFESLFVCEHTHIPASRATPWPGGAELPKQYYHTLDPYVALTAAAQATETLKVATGITLVSQRDPILLAKTVASLDLLSRGRVVLGVGAGWNAEEMAHHGTAFKQRWAIVRERVLAMRALWSEETAAFSGEHVNIEPSYCYPKPHQEGGPPVLVGASSKWTWERIGEYGDGWLPIYQDQARAAASGALDYAAGIAEVRAAWERHGRSGEPDLSIFGVPPKAAIIEELIQTGFQRLLFALPAADADTLLPLLDKLAVRAHEAQRA